MHHHWNSLDHRSLSQIFFKSIQILSFKIFKTKSAVTIWFPPMLFEKCRWLGPKMRSRLCSGKGAFSQNRRKFVPKGSSRYAPRRQKLQWWQRCVSRRVSILIRHRAVHWRFGKGSLAPLKISRPPKMIQNEGYMLLDPTRISQNPWSPFHFGSTHQMSLSFFGTLLRWVPDGTLWRLWFWLTTCYSQIFSSIAESHKFGFYLN